MSGSNSAAELLPFPSPSPSPSPSCQQLPQEKSSPARHRQHPQHQYQHMVEREPPFAAADYRLAGMRHDLEDIVICVDVDAQIDADMKVTGAKGHSLSRLDAIKQAIFLFVHSKLSVHPLHRFAFAGISQDFFWFQHNFTNDIELINSSVRALCSSGSFPRCDLSSLFQTAASLGRKSQAQGRILRVILIYCRSDVVPAYPTDWHQSKVSFTFDALYLHDKPTQENCPQQVYDALVEALERVSLGEGYIYESGSGFTRILFKQMCCLLAHPQQRCGQDDFDVPRDISKVVSTSDATTSSMPMRPEDIGVASKAFV
ncbi:hypothetical protein GOP47_0018905 [Adiantum capillus-veneris]|uniref:New component of the BRCA1-A complex n=1 Tax=Adiantum capillus-veneris TaxID=13818 RepID=A0A9D4ZB54_ADICA|nr:hypothetical protein GOP47_0018905 [Adiantum capillus-veneris]